ncbi:unnamed protein product [Bursaphelenchus okinawaensis]|uniref:ZP domain-containing protein n=1 Tax=Bursaphelenchus okinawaensis TaxID=465554 RepID=A0A811JVR8_9BILA|nr:unnamed protein product [Bursaphelenchus okinawaensis]CAG9085310.1 unnamed protein product [Bursaphelenchus okinawaensis]
MMTKSFFITTIICYVFTLTYGQESNPAPPVLPSTGASQTNVAVAPVNANSNAEAPAIANNVPVTAGNEDCAPKDINVNPININAKCSETTLKLKFKAIDNFYSTVDIDTSAECKGDVSFKLLLDDCVVYEIAKTDIPGGEVLVINKDVSNVITGHVASFELKNTTLKVDGNSKKFDQESKCSTSAALSDDGLAVLKMINSKKGCNVKVLLDPDAHLHVVDQSVQAASLNSTLLIVALVMSIVTIAMLFIFIILWYTDRLPGIPSRPPSPSIHCTYFTRDVFSQPTKPNVRPEPKTESIGQHSIESEADIFDPPRRPRRSIISLYSNPGERRIE